MAMLAKSKAAIHILLIDDDEGITFIYGEALRKAGYTLTVAHSDEAARTALNNSRFDLILLNIILNPVGQILSRGTLETFGGYGLLKYIRAQKHYDDVPIIIFSNLDRDQMWEQCRAAGANAYWTKSEVLPQETADRIQKLLDDRTNAKQRTARRVSA